ncbi:MAG: hypothetical protein JJT99_08480 [Rhodobacteraceae bacterium]|nr:hypothetical protein [Paracoccaceae bacterium]
MSISYSPLRIARATLLLVAVLVVLVLSVGTARPVQAQDLSEAYLLPELFAIMSDESIAAIGAEGASPLSDAGLVEWRAELAAIYDPDRMHQRFMEALADALASHPEITTDALDFAASALGRRVLRLEVSAREALLEPEIDDAARSALMHARHDRPDAPAAHRLALVRERIAVNDLIEMNVSLGLNTSYAYYTGMATEGAASGLGPLDLLALVQAQEEDIRHDIIDWIESYFLMAYQPLSDEEMRAYIAYAASPEGDAFNRAMFRAFDTVFVALSHQVGRALGRRLMTEEL